MKGLNVMGDTHVKFESQHKISPVRLDMSNFDLHLDKREGLFRHLGIFPGLITVKRVLAFGSGSGFHSIHLVSVEPKSLTLVDGNPTGWEQVNDLCAIFPTYKNLRKYECSMFDDYQNEEKFDLVIMENVLVGQPDIDKILMHVASSVTPGTLTCLIM